MAESKRGGRRPGAGRKKGSKGKATLLREALAVSPVVQGRTPLELMVAAMHEAAAVGDTDTAFARAKECAPFFHPRLTATKVFGPTEPEPAPPDPGRLDAIREKIRRRFEELHASGAMGTYILSLSDRGHVQLAEKLAFSPWMEP